MSELDDHVRRILRSEFASGIVDFPTQKSVVDVEGGFETARRIAEQSTVLLKNANGVLPLDRAKLRSIAIIGPHADTGMISGGGSAQVDPPGRAPPKWQEQVWFPTSPLKAVTAQGSGRELCSLIRERPGLRRGPGAGRRTSPSCLPISGRREGMDLPNLSLPENQDALIEQVAAANPRTIVVLETGTAVTDAVARQGERCSGGVVRRQQGCGRSS